MSLQDTQRLSRIITIDRNRKKLLKHSNRLNIDELVKSIL
jgi:hypothetical protein